MSPPNRGERAVLRSWERWQRPSEARVVGGVCAAISRRSGMHPLIVRLSFALLALASGLGVALYVLLWLLWPTEGERLSRGGLRPIMEGRMRSAGQEARQAGRELAAALSDVGRRRAGAPYHEQAWPRPLDRFWLGLAIAGAGALSLLASFGLFAWLTPMRVVGLMALAIGLGLVVGPHLGAQR